MNQPHVIIFDLDGTLAESKQPATAEMGVRLARLLERMPVAVMSGGAYHQFQKQLLPALPAGARLDRLYLFPVSAGQCYAFKDGEWRSVYDHSFTPAERAKVLQALDESLVESGLAEPPARVWGPRIEDRGAQITFSALGQQAPLAEKNAWDPDRKKRAPLQAALLRRLPDFSVRVNATTSVDITRAGITKAYGVLRLADMLGIPIAAMLYVGDALFPGGNDDIVHETGVPTRQVSGPDEVAALVDSLTSAAHK